MPANLDAAAVSQNPSYYDLGNTSSEAVNEYLSDLVGDTLHALEEAGCVEVRMRSRL